MHRKPEWKRRKKNQLKLFEELYTYLFLQDKGFAANVIFM